MKLAVLEVPLEPRYVGLSGAKEEHLSEGFLIGKRSRSGLVAHCVKSCFQFLTGNSVFLYKTQRMREGGWRGGGSWAN